MIRACTAVIRPFCAKRCDSEPLARIAIVQPNIPQDEKFQQGSGIPLALVQRSIENSLCFGGFVGARQVAFARVISDYATFANLVDVFVAATKAKNAKNALAFLSGIDGPATQLAFSKAKGSIPVVHDVDSRWLMAYAAGIGRHDGRRTARAPREANGRDHRGAGPDDPAHHASTLGAGDRSGYGP